MYQSNATARVPKAWVLVARVLPTEHDTRDADAGQLGYSAFKRTRDPLEPGYDARAVLDEVPGYRETDLSSWSRVALFSREGNLGR